MKAAPFEYLRPDTIAEALAALAQYGSDARVLAGGQSLGALLNMRLVKPKVVIDINGLGELFAISLTKQHVVTGALVRQSDAMSDRTIKERVPLLGQALPFVGHYQTRNRGTLVGSVAHADPSAEIPLSLALLDGEIELRTERGERRVRARDFFKSALVTVRQPEELIVALQWPLCSSLQRFCFIEFAVRSGDFAVVAVACAAETTAAGRLSSVRFGFGGCGDRPQIVERPVQVGQGGGDNNVQALADEAASGIEYRSDLTASAEHRRELAALLAAQALRTALAGGGRHA